VRSRRTERPASATGPLSRELLSLARSAAGKATWRWAFIAAAVGVVSGLASAASAPAGTIGRADLDGSNVNRAFVIGASSPVAVAADGGGVYWTNDGRWPTNPRFTVGPSIGRSTLDGADVAHEFITGFHGGSTLPLGLAVHGSRLYWTVHRQAWGRKNAIGSANVDGSRVEHDFIPRLADVKDVAVGGGHVYWIDVLRGRIGRANLDGSDVQPKFITGIDSPTGMTVDANHIYWSDIGGSPPAPGTIARANLDGSGVRRDFITGLGNVGGVAVAGGHIYWTASTPGPEYPLGLFRYSIGRANLDGSGVEPSFITLGTPASGDTRPRPGAPRGIDVDAGHIYWTEPDAWDWDDTTVAIRVQSRRLMMGRDRRVRVRLACPASEVWPPCQGSVQLWTKDKIRYRGTHRRLLLKERSYTVYDGAGATRTVLLRLEKRMGALVRADRRARIIRVVVSVSDAAGNQATETKTLRLGIR
jgi:hypothetical protein